MFDAKNLLDALVRGAQPTQPAPAQGQGLGGLGDLLGQLTQGGGQGAGRQSPGSGGGGLGDILGELTKQLGQAQSPNVAPGGSGSSSGGGAGGLGDILGQLQKQLGGAQAPQMAPGSGQTPSGETPGGGIGDIFGEFHKNLGQAGAGRGSGQTSGQGSGQAGGQQGAGGLLDILGQVLGQATSGVKEGAGKIDDMTGASDAFGKATGKSPDVLLAQLKELIANNQLGAGAAIGGLGGLLLGTRTGRSVAVGAAKLGALALIGGLAYKAYQNYSEGRSPMNSGNTQGLLESPAPGGSGFEPEAVSNDQAILYIRAMIAAAAADGRIDAAEQEKILSGLGQSDIDDAAQAFLRQELQNPATVEDLAQSVSSPQEAVQVFTAARMAVDLDNHAEHKFLVSLASRLGIDGDLAAHIDAASRTAA